jgi:hypothetical protein
VVAGVALVALQGRGLTHDPLRSTSICLPCTPASFEIDISTPLEDPGA